MEGQNAGTKPSWSAVERNPDESKRSKAKKVMGDTYEYERSGLIIKGPLEIMNYEVEQGWQKKEGCESMGMDWRDTMGKIKAA